jgi:hypothetical protein
MSRTMSATAFAVAAALGATACSSDEASSAGTIELSLIGQASSGAVYRLRDAELTIAPAGLVFRTEDDPDRSVISARLPAGLYTLGLADGWRLERVTGSGAETVFAVLTSEAPQPFDVIPGERTPVVLQFRADGQSVQLGEGDVDISIGVDDVPQGRPDGGVSDAQPLPPDAAIDAAPAPDAAIDAAPVPDATPAFVQIVSAPVGVIGNNTPTIEFVTSHPGDTWCFSAAIAERCSSPYTTPPLPDGPQTVAVQTFDGSARAEAFFTVDTTPPQIQLTDELVSLGQRRFFFTASEPAAFACALDSAAFAPCTSPFTTPVLPIFSSHTFRVRATDQVGQVGEVVVSFTVL